MEILPIETVLGDWRDSVYFEDTPEKDPKRFFHPIESYDAGYGSGQYVGLQLGGKPSARVEYHDTDLELHALARDVPAYIDLLAATRGLLYWQPEVLRLRKRKKLSAEFAEFTELFPDLDMKAAANSS